MAAFDYSINLPNPVESVLKGVMIRQQFEQQRSAQQRQQQMQAAIQDLRTNPTTEKFADFYLQFPEMKEQVDTYRSTLGEADKTTLTSAAREATLAQKSGKTDEVAAIFDRYATAAENARRPDLAKQFKDAKRFVEVNPEGADLAVKMFYQGVDPEGFKALQGPDSATSFQKDFAFIKETFGEDAATEFAQYGRGGVVSIPLGNGQTYVGPAASAPGASRWQETGQKPPIDQSAPEILERAANNKAITAAEAGVIKSSLGEKGKGAFEAWRKKNGIRVIMRTGTGPDGRRVIQYEDGTVDYAD